MRKTQILCLLALAMTLLLLPAAAQSTAVDDMAGVLQPALAQEVDSLNRQLVGSGLTQIKIITRDFLGGRDAQAYADQALADALGTGMLLALVIGEEQYALALDDQISARLSAQKAEGILTDVFRTPYLKDRAYDRAVAGFLLRAIEGIGQQAGSPINPGNRLRELAGEAPLSLPAQTAEPKDETSWLDSIFEDAKRSEESARQYDEDARYAEENRGRGLSIFQIALIGFVLYKIFGKKRDSQRKGCGPLGWIFGTWGLSRFFGWRR